MSRACPDCGSILTQYAKKCSCGWGGNKDTMSPLERDQFEAQHRAAMAHRESFDTAQARQWLQDRGIVRKDVVGPERRKKLQTYMKSLVKPAPGTGWAYAIIRDYEAGKYPHEVGYRLACDAVKHPVGKTEEVL